MEKVFIYGTLRDPEIRRKVTKRIIPSGVPDKLYGFTLSSVSDYGETYPIIVADKESKQGIDGEIIEVTKTELTLLDYYEGDLYKRTIVKLFSETEAWVYLQP